MSVKIWPNPLNTLPSEIIIWTNLNLPYLRMVPHILQFTARSFSEKEIFKDCSLYIPMWKFNTPMRPHLTHGDYDFIKLESTLTEVAFTLVSAFLSDRLLRWFWEIFPNIFLCKKLPPPSLCPHHNPRDHDVNRCEYTLPEDALIWVTAFLADWFLRRRFFKIFLNIFICKNSTSYCGCTLPQRIMIIITFNLHYLRMRPHKLQLFWLIGVKDEYFLGCSLCIPV